MEGINHTWLPLSQAGQLPGSSPPSSASSRCGSGSPVAAAAAAAAAPSAPPSAAGSADAQGASARLQYPHQLDNSRYAPGKTTAVSRCASTIY